MIKRLLTYIISFSLYVIIPGQIQNVFIKYDDYFFYILVITFLILNVVLAMTLFKLPNKLSYMYVGAIITLIGATAAIFIAHLLTGLARDGIAIFSNAGASIIGLEIIFQLIKKKADNANS